MPQSLSNILVHLVFSTKGRAPHLIPDIRAELFPYATGVLRNLDCPLLQIGGVEDHVHILFQLPRTAPLAHVVEKVKTATSKWIKTKGSAYANFAWQAGYGAFSIGAGDAEETIRYIQTQEEHHRKTTFQEEVRALMVSAGIEIDERYVWD